MGSLHNGLALRIEGNTKGVAYPPRTEELVEFLGNVSWAIISLYGPWHPPLPKGV